MSRSRSLTRLIVCSLLATAPAYGVIGPADPCPLPTPYPPPGAGAGSPHNPDMEGGFTGGAANQWIAWKDATYTGQVHLAGTDRFAQGSASQKLYLPQPPPGYADEEAGLYQQIWVVPGGTYTATAKIYLVPPPGAAYNGEDLVAWIGLDPFGQPAGTSGGMTWSVSAATPNTWITATTTVQAVLPVMTLSLKGTRKWPQHGNSAYVWFDAVTLSGPVPTGTPPGPDPLPPDPESLIPATIGPNLVTNPSFESPRVGTSGGPPAPGPGNDRSEWARWGLAVTTAAMSTKSAT